MYEKLNIVEYIRDDYAREKYDVWLLNGDWKVLPTLYLNHDEGFVISTCRHHNGGSKKMTIHTPRLPKHILPPKFSDQLTHAVIECRTIKPMKTTKYSTQFQLCEQKGTFNGIDTFSITDFQNMEISSELLAHYESLAVVYRRDINSLLTKLTEEKRIGLCVANNRREEAIHRVDRLEIKKDDLILGATYVPIECVMKLLEYQSKCNLRSVSITHQDRQYNQLFKPLWPIYLYPCQKMDLYGAPFPVIPTYMALKATDGGLMDTMTTISLWLTSALLTRIQFVWESISQVELNTSQWEGWILTLLSRKCFQLISKKHKSKSDPFKQSECKNALDIYNKFDRSNDMMSSPKVVFEKVKDKILIVEYEADEYNDIYLNQNLTDSHSVVIIYDYDIEENDIELEKSFLDKEFELRFISSTWQYSATSRGRTRSLWDGFIYSRHGGSQHCEWWYFERKDKMPIQFNGTFDFKSQKKVVLAYVKCEETNIKNHKHQFMSYLGGKNNIYCDEHKSPMICSTTRDLKCVKCQRKIEYIKCCTLGCTCCLCKDCSEDYDPSMVTYISQNENQDNEQVDNVSLEDSTVSNEDNDTEGMFTMNEMNQDNFDDSTVSNEDNDTEGMVTMNETNQDNFDDDFKDFLISDEDPDMICGDDHEYFPTIPTTNAGEHAFTITDHGRQQPINRVSGHVILNQCGSLLCRLDHQIKGSSKHNFFLQKIHSTSHGESIPLLYPESMLFPSIFPFSDADGFSSVGSIPVVLLSRTMGSQGFESIPQHNRIRLTTPFCK